MAESTAISAALKVESVPRFGAIIDITKLYNYVQGVYPLDIVSNLMGFEDLLELLVCSCLSEDSDPEEEMNAVFSDRELLLFEENDISLEELQYELISFQRYRDIHMLGSLKCDIQENLNEYGFEIKKWLSPFTVIIDSYECERVPSRSESVRFRNKTYESVGSDRRLIRPDQAMRTRTGITSIDVPY